MELFVDTLQMIKAMLSSGLLVSLGGWEYLLLALLVAVEGPVATLVGAVAASAGMMEPALVFISAAGGNLLADTLWYSLGYFGKSEWLFHGGRRLGIKKETLTRFQSGMRRHATKILFFAKISVSFVIPSLVAAGLVKAPWKRWFPAVFGGEMIWTGSLVLIGYYAATAIKEVEKGMSYFIAFASVAFLGLVFWLGRRMIRSEFGRQNGESGPAEGQEE
jgi:membrane protein DedA with SNARE-associated domain